jgi:hypothetical protein
MSTIVYDTEMGEYGLDDCERWGNTDTECWGRVGGVIRVNEADEGQLLVVLCEGHFNGKRPDGSVVTEAVTTERLYVVCDACGEAFDDLSYASSHEETVHTFEGNPSYSIKPESEAL